MKKIMCAVLCILLAGTASMFAAEQTSGSYADGLIAGEAMAKGQGIHYLSGCLLGPVALIFPYIGTPDIPASMIMGKSGEYILGFKEGYTIKSRKINMKNAVVGCAASSLAYVAVWGVYIGMLGSVAY